MQRHISYLISGLILLAISLVSLLNKYVVPSMDIRGFLFLWIFGIISLILYRRQKGKALLIFGLILPALGTYNLIEQISFGNVSWAFYLLLGISFYIIYIIGYSKSAIEWPKYLALIMVILSILFLLSSKSIGQFRFWKFISYLWPILLIGIGIKIIYNMIKLK